MFSWLVYACEYNVTGTPENADCILEFLLILLHKKIVIQ